MTRLTAALAGTGGRLLREPDDFFVDERLPYSPCGEGEHLFLRVEKRGLDTLEAVRRVAARFEVRPDDVGVAGLKDRHAVARQWLSLPWRGPPPPAGPVDDALSVLEAVPHRHKLRRGHVLENRFEIRIRDVPAGGADRAERVLSALRATGVPHRFGPQRFGAGQSNAERARDVLERRSPRPRDGRLLRLLMSALQSEVFNRTLDLRIEAGLFARALAGDRMVKHATGGQFAVEDPDREQPRVDSLEISPTGSLPGRKCPPVLGVAAEMEAEALRATGLDAKTVARLGPGTRRPLRYPLDPEAAIEPTEDGFWLRVALPAGAYATVVLDEIVKPEAGPFEREAPPPPEG